ALAESLQKQGDDFLLHVLVVDSGPLSPLLNCKFYTVNDLANETGAAVIIKKYGKNQDKLRWCMKPVFLKYLIALTGEPVIYVDNDLFFFSNYTFLFDLL